MGLRFKRSLDRELGKNNFKARIYTFTKCKLSFQIRPSHLLCVLSSQLCLTCFVFQKSVSIQQRRDEADASVFLQQILINWGGFKNKRTVAKPSLHLKLILSLRRVLLKQLEASI